MEPYACTSFIGGGGVAPSAEGAAAAEGMVDPRGGIGGVRGGPPGRGWVRRGRRGRGRFDYSLRRNCRRPDPVMIRMPPVVEGRRTPGWRWWPTAEATSTSSSIATRRRRRQEEQLKKEIAYLFGIILIIILTVILLYIFLK